MKKWIPTVDLKTWWRARHGIQTVAASAVPPPHQDHPLAGLPGTSDLPTYLLERENRPEDILKLNTLLSLPQVLLEIGCGDAEAARRIALANPGIGVIATDLYDCSQPQRSDNSYYGRIAGSWRTHRLPAQMETPPNLVILRAEAELLRLLPDRVVDTLFALNPEPAVGKSLLDLIRKESLLSKFKQGPMQIVILPYSRELGVMACGGCEFEHDPDWSRGLGFIMGSGLAFRRGDPCQWGVDLTRISAYTGNSTQKEIYICGQLPD